MATAINKSKKLPDYVLVTLDDDLIEFLGYKNCDVGSMYGTWCEWLVKQFDSLLTTKWQRLPNKAKNNDGTQVYWIALPLHQGFSDIDNQVRQRFNDCLESVVKMYGAMRVIKIKQIWNFDNRNPVVNGRITVNGLTHLWQGVDAAFQFNARKRNEFLIREKFRALQEGREQRRPLPKNEQVQSKKSREKEFTLNFMEQQRRASRFRWTSGMRRLPTPSPLNK